MTTRPHLLLLVLALVLAAPPSRAQQPGAEDTAAAAARNAYKQGMHHYTLDEFDAAIVSWKEGYRIKGAPEFLYNIAQAYRMSKRPDDAVNYYRKYLKANPEAPNRAEVDRHIAQLTKLIEAQRSAATAPPFQPIPTGGTGAGHDSSPVGPSLVDKPADTTAGEGRTGSSATTESHATDLQLAAAPSGQPTYKKAWFWGVVGGAVAVVAGVVIAGVLLSGDSPTVLPMARF